MGKTAEERQLEKIEALEKRVSTREKGLYFAAGLLKGGGKWEDAKEVLDKHAAAADAIEVPE